MAREDKIFVLVQSLTQAEKSYFTKYSRMSAVKEKPDYLRLFEFLDTQKKYNELAIKKYFSQEKFIHHLARKKSQLRDKILESLSMFYTNRTIEATLRQRMNVLPILHEKTLAYADLERELEQQIRSIKKVAKKHKCEAILSELEIWEKRLGKTDKNRGIGKLHTVVTCCFYNLNNQMNAGEFDKAAGTAEEIEQCWNTFCQSIPQKQQLAYCYDMLMLYWQVDKSDKAVVWLCRILNCENIKGGEHYVHDARVLQLPIFYDYHNRQLEHRIESTRRVLANQNRLSEFERMVISCFRKLVRCTHSKEGLAVIGDLYRKQLEYQQKHPSQIQPTWAAIKLWCERKGVAAVG